MSADKLPQPKHQVSIKLEHPTLMWIWFVAVPDVVASIRDAQFGRLDYNEGGEHWELSVNPLYDFEEVLAWIKAQDNEDRSKV